MPAEHNARLLKQIATTNSVSSAADETVVPPREGPIRARSHFALDKFQKGQLTK
jgi:hypothetical protein